MKCPLCGEGELKRELRAVPYTYRGTTVEVEQPGDWCSACGEGALSVEDMAATAKACHDMIATKEGLLTCDEIRRIRTKLGLSQADAAELFGGGVNAFSRYERGVTMQPRALDQLLRLLDRHPNQVEELHHAA
jgi:HTH-type transcriptional regulator / antitoxin MqsA